MKVLVIGGTGTVGSQTVKELLQKNMEVHVLTRDPEKAKSLPEGAKAVIGNILDPETVKSIFKGMDGVFMLNPVSTEETTEGLFAINGARMAGVKRFVYMSVQDIEKAVHLPHFGSKLSIETALKDSGIPYTILRPNNFYQNDYWFKDAILQYGVYPQPLGNKGTSRVDVRDIAELAAIAMTSDEHEGKTYNLVGPEPLTGPGTAELWSKALGKKVSYGGDDLEAWEQQSLQYLPAWMVFDFKLMYDHFQRNGFYGTQEDVNRLTEVLGHAPRRFEDFAKETAEQWSVLA
ncbi:SDR family oxidoreductase [Pontibacter locisalis]|uniref:SDR family oxidoreductase n=1 Tax=Pontibacter locisalis TaxID=1719035 RepID=A0ABW5IJV6_9BACT